MENNNQAVVTEVATQEQAPRRLSNHINHPNCVELRELLAVVPMDTQIVRGTKNAKFVPLITEKEQALVEAFISSDFNIKKTGEVMGFSHTNVWQRLYGDNKKDKPAKGVLGKLRQFNEGGYVTELPVVEETVSEVEEQAEAV